MIDWDRIRELESDIGKDSFAELAELFVAEVEAELDAIDTSAPKEVLARQLHALKGSALNLGFADLAKLCAEGEMRAAAGQIEAVQLPEIRAIYRTSKSAFEAGEAASVAFPKTG
jgi:HPt (histidine-containing phosphotransfer) domain-containing protein